MRTEKEIKDKIFELKSKFLEEENLRFDLRSLKRTLNILNWVLGKDWINLKQARNHGARLKNEQ